LDCGDGVGGFVVDDVVGAERAEEREIVGGGGRDDGVAGAGEYEEKRLAWLEIYPEKERKSLAYSFAYWIARVPVAVLPP
jgi:hypothetical protein